MSRPWHLRVEMHTFVIACTGQQLHHSHLVATGPGSPISINLPAHPCYSPFHDGSTPSLSTSERTGWHLPPTATPVLDSVTFQSQKQPHTEHTAHTPSQAAGALSYEMGRMEQFSPKPTLAGGLPTSTTVQSARRPPPYPRAPTRAGGAGRLTNSISTAPEKLSPANTVKGTRYVPVVSNM